MQYPRKPPTLITTGTSVLTLRDAPPAGFAVVGPHSLKRDTVHMVVQDKPLYEWVDGSQPGH